MQKERKMTKDLIVDGADDGVWLHGESKLIERSIEVALCSGVAAFPSEEEKRTSSTHEALELFDFMCGKPFFQEEKEGWCS